jgi:hypothetical protein
MWPNWWFLWLLHISLQIKLTIRVYKWHVVSRKVWSYLTKGVIRSSKLKQESHALTICRGSYNYCICTCKIEYPMLELSKWIHLRLSLWIRIAHRVSFLCCIVCFYFFLSSSCALYVSSISGLPLRFYLTFINTITSIAIRIHKDNRRWIHLLSSSIGYSILHVHMQ